MRRIQAMLLLVTLLCFAHICDAVVTDDSPTETIQTAPSQTRSAPPAPFNKSEACETKGRTGADIRVCLRAKQIDRVPINALTAPPQGAADAPVDPN